MKPLQNVLSPHCLGASHKMISGNVKGIYNRWPHYCCVNRSCSSQPEYPVLIDVCEVICLQLEVHAWNGSWLEEPVYITEKLTSIPETPGTTWNPTINHLKLAHIRTTNKFQHLPNIQLSAVTWDWFILSYLAVWQPRIRAMWIYSNPDLRQTFLKLIFPILCRGWGLY